MPDEATWYFDPISPYVYLQLPDLDRLPPGVRIRPVPVPLAALLKHWGTRGPAGTPGKAAPYVPPMRLAGSVAQACVSHAAAAPIQERL